MNNNIAEILREHLETALRAISQKPMVSLGYDVTDGSPYINLGKRLMIVFYEDEIAIEIMQIDSDCMQEKSRYPKSRLVDVAIVAMQTYLNIEVMSPLEQKLLEHK